MFLFRRARWRPRRNIFIACCGVLTLCSLYVLNISFIETRSGYLNSQLSFNRFYLFQRRVPLTDVIRLPADDPTLVEVVRSRLFIPPSKLDYNLTDDTLKDHSHGPSLVVDELVGQKEDGFFVECGARDGEGYSVSLFLERERHWTGLLVEPRPLRFQTILAKHRKAYVVNACARLNSTSTGDAINGASPKDLEQSFQLDPSVPCFWMKTFLLAAGRKNIDLLAVDLNGKELQLLRTVPFKDVKINLISVHIPFSLHSSELIVITDFLNEKGFQMQHQFVNHVIKKKDVVFSYVNGEH